MRVANLVVVSVIGAAVSGVANAQTANVEATTESPGHVTSATTFKGGAAANGMPGGYRIGSAIPLNPGDLVLVLGGDYSYATDLFEKGDTNTRNSQSIYAIWSPLAGLALGARQSVVSNRNTAFTPNTTQNLGDPAFLLKFGMPIDAMAFGAMMDVTLPTSAKGSGLNPEGFIMNAVAAFTYSVGDSLAMSVNAGYRLDNSRKIFKREILAVQRFTAGISEKNAILGGLAVESSLKVGDMMVFGPFAELSAAVPLGAPAKQGPVRGTLGVKLLPFGPDNVDVSVGGDYAIMGTPVDKGKMAGIAPWEVFAMVAAHLGPDPVAAPQMVGPKTCTQDPECSAFGQVCVDGVCGKIREVVTVKEVVKEVERPIPTFTVEGGVFDQASGDPVGSATVQFSGTDGSPLSVDYKTGNFKSWPIPVGEGLLKVTVQAPNYRPYEETLPKGKAGETKTLALKIQSAGEAARGEIKGSLKNANTGAPLKVGQIFIPILKQTIRVDAEGKFSAQVKAGRYQVLISAPKHITQKKEVEIRAGDVVIFNVDMTPKR